MADPAWSYSRLKNFETCPKQFWHLNIQKDVKMPESKEMGYGKKVHKAIELFITSAQPLPADLQHLMPVLDKFVSAPGEKHAEQQLAITKDLTPTGWFDKDVWCRAIVDLAVVNGDRAVLCDWKTGKIDDDFTQQRAAAALFFIHYPEVERITMMYYWIKDKKATSEELVRPDVRHVWRVLMPRVAKYTYAHEKTEFPPKPSGLCKRHCPVKSCPHNGG